jgi:hypothetical protein
LPPKGQQAADEEYHKKAEKLNLEQGAAPGDMGPLQKELNEYGKKGRVIAPVVEAFAEISPDAYTTAGLISPVLAHELFSFFADKLSEAKGMFTQRLYRFLGLAAHLGWVVSWSIATEIWSRSLPLPASALMAATTSPSMIQTRLDTRTTTAFTHQTTSISEVGEISV